MFTLLAIERGATSPKSHYTGNVMEQKRYDLIISIVKIATDFEYPQAVPVADLLRPLVSEHPQQADDVASQSASKRAYGHAAAFVPGHGWT